MEYKFKVDGVLRKGEQIQTASRRGTLDYAEKECAKYSKGKKVNVFYNPKNSDDCLLVPGVHPGVPVFIVFGAGLVVLGCFMPYI